MIDVFADADHRIGLPTLEDDSGQNPPQTTDDDGGPDEDAAARKKRKEKLGLSMHGTFDTGEYSGDEASSVPGTPVAHRIVSRDNPRARGHIPLQEINERGNAQSLSRNRPPMSPRRRRRSAAETSASLAEHIAADESIVAVPVVEESEEDVANLQAALGNITPVNEGVTDVAEESDGL